MSTDNNDITKRRFNEIDIIKGFAVCAMILFHIPYLADNMGLIHIKNMYGGVLGFLARFAQWTFLGMVGVNMVLSYQKNTQSKYGKDVGELIFHSKQTIRALKVGFFALIYSYLSWLIFPDKWIKFGILHFAAVAIFIFQWVIHSVGMITVLSLLVVCVSLYKTHLVPFFREYIHPMVSFIVGIYNDRYTALDHFPLVPTLIFIGVGSLLANIVYKNYKRNLDIEIFDKDKSEYPKIIQWIAWLGHHSFEVYVYHFPIIYFILYLIKKVTTKDPSPMFPIPQTF